MKVLIGNFVLCPGGRDSDEEAETASSRVAEIAQAVRASDARVLRRGNRAFSFTFSKTTEHGSFGEAERHRILHPAEIPNEGILTFITEGDGGGEGALYFATHNVDQVRIRQIGVSTVTTYTISAAGPTTKRPTTTD